MRDPALTRANRGRRGAAVADGVVMWKRVCAALVCLALIGGVLSVTGCSGEKNGKKEIDLTDTEGR